MVKPLGLILDVPIELSIEVGRKKMKLGDVLKLNPGAIIKLEQRATDTLNLLVNGEKIANGEMVTTGEDRIAFRVLTVVEDTERIKRLESDVTPNT